MLSKICTPNNIYQEIKSILIASLIWIFFLIPCVFLPIILPFTVLKLLIIFLAKVFKPDLIPFTNPVDNTFASKFSNQKDCQATNLIFIWKLKGKLDAEKFRTHFYHCFLSTDKLRQEYENFYCTFAQWMGYTFKKHLGLIDLRDRIRDYNWALEDVSKLDFVFLEKLTSGDFGGDNKPRWEFSIFNIYSDCNATLVENCLESVIIFRIDHVFADAFTLKNIIDTLAGISTPRTKVERGPGFFQKVKSKFLYPKIFFNLMLNFASEKPTHRLLSTANTKGSQKLISFTTLDLDKIKKIRRESDTHFSVVMGMIQVGATRRYLLQTGRINCKEELPEYTTIGCPTAVPNHPAYLEHSFTRMTNHMGFKYWKVPVSQNELNISDHLREAEEDFIKKDVTEEDKMFHEFAAPLCWPLPNIIIHLFYKTFTHFDAAPTSQLLSTFKFSHEEYSILRCPLSKFYFATTFESLAPYLKLCLFPATNGSRMDISVVSMSDAFQTQSELDLFTQVLLKEELDCMAALQYPTSIV